MNFVALWVAALSATGFAVSTSLQHHANTQLSGDLGAAGSVLTLVRRPAWVLGQVVALLAFGLHAWALHLGRLVVVQPVVVSGIVLAVPVRSALARRLPGRSEVATVALAAAGLALFLATVRPRSGQPGTTALPGVVTAVGVAVAAAAAVGAARQTGVARATGFGLASGVLFGLTAGLTKLVLADAAQTRGVADCLATLAGSWHLWALLVVGLSGVALNQRAYRAGPLSASMPLLNVVDVFVAIAFGLLVFGEVPAHHASALVAECTAVALMAVSLRRLAGQATEKHSAPCAPTPSRRPL